MRAPARSVSPPRERRLRAGVSVTSPPETKVSAGAFSTDEAGWVACNVDAPGEKGSAGDVDSTGRTDTGPALAGIDDQAGTGVAAVAAIDVSRSGGTTGRDADWTSEDGAAAATVAVVLESDALAGVAGGTTDVAAGNAPSIDEIGAVAGRLRARVVEPAVGIARASQREDLKRCTSHFALLRRDFIAFSLSPERWQARADQLQASPSMREWE